MLELRRRFRKFRDIRTQVRNIAGFNIGGGTFDIDFALRGPELEKLAEYGAILKEKARELGGIADADTTLQLDKPELRVVIDRERAADLRVDTDADRHRAAPHGGRRRPGLALPRSDRQRRLRRADPPDRTPTASDLKTISRLYVSRDSASNATATGAAAQVGLAPAGGLVRLDNVVRIERAATASRIDRTDRQREVRLRAQIAPGYGQADRIEAAQAGGGRDEPAARLHHGRRPARPGSWRRPSRSSCGSSCCRSSSCT